MSETICSYCGEPLRTAGGVHTPEIPRPVCVDCAIAELERVKAKDIVEALRAVSDPDAPYDVPTPAQAALLRDLADWDWKAIHDALLYTTVAAQEKGDTERAEKYGRMRDRVRAALQEKGAP